jgi:hypothetical protein
MEKQPGCPFRLMRKNPIRGRIEYVLGEIADP